MRRLTVSFSPISSSGAKNTPATFCAMKDCANCSASFAVSRDGSGCIAPQQRVGACEGRAHHAVADGLEDFGQTQLGNQQAEGAARRRGAAALHVGARAGPPCDQVHALQVEDGLGHRDARGVEQLAQFRLAGQAVAGLELTGLDAGEQVVKDPAMLGHALSRLCLRRGRQHACRFAWSGHPLGFLPGPDSNRRP